MTLEQSPSHYRELSDFKLIEDACTFGSSMKLSSVLLVLACVGCFIGLRAYGAPLFFSFAFSAFFLLPFANFPAMRRRARLARRALECTAPSPCRLTKIKHDIDTNPELVLQTEGDGTWHLVLSGTDSVKMPLNREYDAELYLDPLDRRPCVLRVQDRLLWNFSRVSRSRSGIN